MGILALRIVVGLGVTIGLFGAGYGLYARGHRTGIREAMEMLEDI